MFRLIKRKKKFLTATELKVQYFFYACRKVLVCFGNGSIYETIIEFKFYIPRSHNILCVYRRPMSYGFSCIARIDGATTEKSFFGHLPLRELKL